jgi:hypothetical protein
MMINKSISSSKDKAVWSICATLFWYLFAHGYRMANNIFSHDSLLEIYQDDSAWQIALGRIMQPILIFLRGGITNPWLIGFCALIWLTAAVYLVIDILEIHSVYSVIMIAGVMVCNPTLISTNASFLQVVDFYALALFCSVFGIWLCKRRTIVYTILGIIALAVSMGIYQAYICVSITLVMILILMAIWEKHPIKDLAKRLVLYCGCLVISALMFYLTWRMFQKIFGIWTANTYNGMAGLGDYSDIGILSLLGMTYKNVLSYFWNPEIFTTMEFKTQSMSVVWLYLIRLANLCIVVKIILEIILKNIREKVKWGQIALQIVILALLPMGMNFVCVMSKGMEHMLMIYAFVLFYVLAIWMQEQSVMGKDIWKKIFGAVLVISTSCVIWSNVVYANQVYLKKDLQEKSMSSLMTRIVADIEDMEGYEPGVTPVAFVGTFENSPYIQNLVGFEDILPHGMGKTVLTYSGTEKAFLKYELSVLINETSISAEDEEVKKMPVYPLNGSVEYVGDVLVVKISQ